MRGRGIGRFFPGAVALARYDPAWLRPDLVAGVSVAAVAVPVAIAYSQLAGVPPVYGLYASILPLVAYALLGTSRRPARRAPSSPPWSRRSRGVTTRVPSRSP